MKPVASVPTTQHAPEGLGSTLRVHRVVNSNVGKTCVCQHENKTRPQKLEIQTLSLSLSLSEGRGVRCECPPFASRRDWLAMGLALPMASTSRRAERRPVEVSTSTRSAKASTPSQAVRSSTTPPAFSKLRRARATATAGRTPTFSTAGLVSFMV